MCVLCASDEFARCRDEDCNGFILAAEFDLLTKFFAACTDCKQLLVWKVGSEWKLHNRRFVGLATLDG